VQLAVVSTVGAGSCRRCFSFRVAVRRMSLALVGNAEYVVVLGIITLAIVSAFATFS